MITENNKIALGTVQFGLNYGISNKYGKPMVNEINRILKHARESKISLLDTAPAYGDSEQVLGQKHANCFNIVTKTPHFKNDVIVDSDAQYLKKVFKESIDLLKVKSVYGLLIHNVKDLYKKGADKLLMSLEELKTHKSVCKVGVSVYNRADVEHVLSIFKPDIIQLPISIFDQRLLRDGTLKKIKDQGIEIHARSLFLQGLVFFEEDNLPYHLRSFKPHIRGFREFLLDSNLSPVEASISFGNSISELNKLIIGVNSLKELEEVTSVKELLSLSCFEKFAVDDAVILNPANWKSK